MSMFLVVLRHMLDDVPYKACSTMEQARGVLAAATEELAYEIADRLKLDCHSPVVWAIYEFDEDGNPVTVHFDREARDIDNPRLATALRPEDLKGIPVAGDPAAWIPRD